MSEVLILAGGLGTRLRPLNLGVSKPIAPVGDGTFLERQIDYLVKRGFRSFLLAISRQTLDIKERLGDVRGRGISVAYSVDPKPIGTGSAVLRALPRLRDPFMVVNGDTLFSFDPTAVLAQHEGFGGDATVAVVRKRNNGRYTNVLFGSDGRVTSLNASTKNSYGYVNAGVAVMRKRAFKGFRKELPLSLEKDIMVHIASRKRLFAAKVHGTFWDIGTPRSYRHFQSIHKL